MDIYNFLGFSSNTCFPNFASLGTYICEISVLVNGAMFPFPMRFAFSYTISWCGMFMLKSVRTFKIFPSSEILCLYYSMIGNL